MQLAARRAETFQVIQGSLGVAVLPGVDSDFLRVLEQLDHVLGSMPGRLVLAEQPVEVRVAVDVVTADDEAGNGVGTELDRGKGLRRG